MHSDHADSIAGFIQSQQLPPHYLAIIEQCWLPLADSIAGTHNECTRLIDINGAQGTGKSTMAAALSLLLQERHGLHVAVISMDDLYLTRDERKQLAASAHPLLQTRGAPGTHDVALGMQLMTRLQQADDDSDVALPRFDKATDDRLPRAQWPHHPGRADVILFEGWCVGTPAQSDAALNIAINALEANEDSDGRWRRYVNTHLADDYQRLFARMDMLILLKAPDFEAVYGWREQQEEKLRAVSPQGAHVMDKSQLDRFIQHYERLTRHNLTVLPRIADIVFDFNRAHEISGVHHRWARP